MSARFFQNLPYRSPPSTDTLPYSLCREKKTGFMVYLGGSIKGFSSETSSLSALVVRVVFRGSVEEGLV